ncbi:hypothetical protein KEM55_005398 [Ascosphaera atra]|nr:hypothetical protein KEM55_005398 [Ascosphaera atra]
MESQRQSNEEGIKPVSEQATYHAEDKDAAEEGGEATAPGLFMGVIRAASRTAVQVFTGRESWRQNQYSSHSAQSLDTSEAERQREAVEIAKLKLEAAKFKLEDAKRESEFALLMQEYKAKVLENELKLKRLEAQLQAEARLGAAAVAAADPEPDPPGDAPTTAPSSPSPAR